MDYAVFWRGRWLRYIVVVELDGVDNVDSLGGGINKCVSAVVVEV